MTGQKFRGFQKLSLTATMATFFLIFIGGLVRVSGAGLGCPDWPKCFGRWIPPLSVNDLPAGFDPQTFNVTLAWIEYINRLIGVLVGFLILATAVMAVLYFRKHRRIVIPAVVATLLVAFQGWFGSVVVSSELEPVLVSLHLLLALVIVSLMTFVTQSAFYLKGDVLPFASPEYKSLRIWIVVLWIFAIIQIAKGTQVRSQIEFILREYPLLFGVQLVEQIGFINYVHSIFGLVFTAVSLVAGILLLRIAQFRILAVFVILLPLIQILLGSGMEILGIPAILQVFHLWFASLIIGILLILYAQLLYTEGKK